MLNWIWSRRPSSDRRASIAPGLRPWRRAISSTDRPAGLQLPEQAVDGADNLGVIVHTFIRQAIARDRVYAVRKRQKQFSCTVDVHTLTFSDKYESFSLL